MSTYVFVGCGSDKAEEPRPARDLYTSDFFAKRRRVAELIGDKWWVLSAKHHVVQPDEVLEPYDRTLSKMTEDQIAAWAAEVKVALSMAPWLDDAESRLVVLAGMDYYEPWAEWIREEHEVELDLPFAETEGIGEQNRILKRWIRELENSSLADYC